MQDICNNNREVVYKMIYLTASSEDPGLLTNLGSLSGTLPSFPTLSVLKDFFFVLFVLCEALILGSLVPVICSSENRYTLEQKKYQINA